MQELQLILNVTLHNLRPVYLPPHSLGDFWVKWKAHFIHKIKDNFSFINITSKMGVF